MSVERIDPRIAKLKADLAVIRAAAPQHGSPDVQEWRDRWIELDAVERVNSWDLFDSHPARLARSVGFLQVALALHAPVAPDYPSRGYDRSFPQCQGCDEWGPDDSGAVYPPPWPCATYRAALDWTVA